jgi:transposase
MMQEVHVGIDISKLTFHAAYKVCNKGKYRWEEREFRNNETGYKNLVSWAGPTALFTMEATGLYHVKTAMYLHENKYTVYVVNPLKIKRFSQMQFRRSKTDKADARVISEFLEMNKGRLKKWVPTTTNLAKARSLLTAIKLLRTQNTAKKNAIQALQLTPDGMEALTQLKALQKSEQTTILSMEREMIDLVCVSHAEEFNLAQTIPSIGPKTAAAVILATDGLKSFDTSRQLCAYFGMSPRQYQSGTSVNGKGHICKMGNPYIRSLLYICAVSSLRFNKTCRAFYDSLVERGKAKKLALNAVANKLLRTLFAVVKNKKSWSIEGAL